MSGANSQASTTSRYRVAYASVPKDSGTFTFYRNLRPALAAHGIQLICVTVGRREASLVEQAYVDDGCVVLLPESTDVKEQAEAFVGWCEAMQVDVVMAINSAAVLSALPHLPSRVRIFARCANAFDEGYRVTLSARERIAHIVALTPRLRDDLVSQYAVSADEITLIPNGINPAPYDAIMQASQTTHRKTLSLGFLGRLEHNQKGVLHLPGIVTALRREGVDFHLRIAGKGKHEKALRGELANEIADGSVEFVGSLDATAVPGFLSSIDVLLFTSHFEGCPNTLLEAMMAGAVPVAFEIPGIIDFIIDNGRTGLIAPSGDCAAFARQVKRLSVEPGMRIAMGENAAREARQRFTPDIAARAYARLVDDVIHLPATAVAPIPWSQFRVDPVYDPGWKSLVPEAARRLARKFRARA